MPDNPVTRWRRAFVSDEGPESATSVAILQFLSTEMDKNGDRCFPSYGTIAKRTRFDTRTVERHVKQLEREGWLGVSKRRGKFGFSNQYHPAIPHRVSARDRHPVGRQTAPGAADPGGAETSRVGTVPVGLPGQARRVGKLPAQDPKLPAADAVTTGPVPVDLVVPGYLPGDVGAHARGGEEDELTEWLGDHALAVTEPPWDDPRTRATAFQHYGPPGLRPNAWARPDGSSVPEGERPRVFALAASGYSAEGHEKLVTNEFAGMLRATIRSDAVPQARQDDPSPVNDREIQEAKTMRDAAKAREAAEIERLNAEASAPRAIEPVDLRRAPAEGNRRAREEREAARVAELRSQLEAIRGNA